MRGCDHTSCPASPDLTCKVGEKGRAAVLRGKPSLRKTSLDLHGEAAAALMANAATAEFREVRSMAVRLGKLVRRLERFSFPLVVAPLAGLLTRPENHSATARIEALIHLAALACRGNKEPRLQHLREWLNTTVFKDPISQLEVPVEDVFVSNVGTWFGNARLFEGRWQSNADYVQVCVETLLRLAERPWVMQTLRHVMALLRVSESVADRARDRAEFSHDKQAEGGDYRQCFNGGRIERPCQLQ